MSSNSQLNTLTNLPLYSMINAPLTAAIVAQRDYAVAFLALIRELWSDKLTALAAITFWFRVKLIKS